MYRIRVSLCPQVARLATRSNALPVYLVRVWAWEMTRYSQRPYRSAFVNGVVLPVNNGKVITFLCDGRDRYFA